MNSRGHGNKIPDAKTNHPPWNIKKNETTTTKKGTKQANIPIRPKRPTQQGQIPQHMCWSHNPATTITHKAWKKIRCLHRRDLSGDLAIMKTISWPIYITRSKPIIYLDKCVTPLMLSWYAKRLVFSDALVPIAGWALFRMLGGSYQTLQKPLGVFLNRKFTFLSGYY